MAALAVATPTASGDKHRLLSLAVSTSLKMLLTIGRQQPELLNANNPKSSQLTAPPHAAIVDYSQ